MHLCSNCNKLCKFSSLILYCKTLKLASQRNELSFEPISWCVIVNYEFLMVFVFALFLTLIFHAVSVALHVLLNTFFKLYDLNGDD